MNDAIVGMVWLGFNLILLRITWETVGHFFSGDTLVQRIMHVVVVTWAAVVAICLALGAFGMLKPIWMGVSSIVLVSGVAVWLAWRTDTQHTANHISGWTDRSRQVRVYLWGWSALAGLLGASLIERGLLRFPNDWDSLMYHIPFIDHWLQGGSLYAPACAVWYFPGNSEIVGFWLVAPFSGDFWVGLINLPSALLLVCGILELGQQFGVTTALRNALALAVIATSVFIRQIATSENDIAVVGLFVVGIVYGIRTVRSGRRADLAMVALSLGLLAGVKYYAVGYAGVVWLGLSLLCVHRRGLKELARMALAGALATFCLGAYWYLRNFWQTGSPVYPLGLSEGVDGLEGLRTGRWATSLLGGGRADIMSRWVAAVWEQAGPCQAAAALAVPLMSAWLIVSGFLQTVRPARDRCPADLRFLLALLLLGSLLIFCVTPNTVVPNSDGRQIFKYLSVRFSQCPLALAVLALGLTLTDISDWLAARNRPGAWPLDLVRRAPSVSFICLAAAQLFLHLSEILGSEPAVVLLLALDLVAIGVWTHAFWGTIMGRRVIVVIVLVGSGASSALLSYYWHRDFADHYDAIFQTKVFSSLNRFEAIRPTIGVVDYRCYPFFGSRRQFHVDRPAKILSESSLISYLASHRIDIVSVERRDNPIRAARYRGAGVWAKQNTHILTFMFGGNNFDVYKVDRGAIARREASIKSHPRVRGGDSAHH